MAKKLQGCGGQRLPLIVAAKDITDLNHKLSDRLLWGTKDELSYYSSIDTMAADVLAMARSSAYSLDIGREVWTTPSRWNTLIRQYLDPERVFKWLEGVKAISTYSRGIAALDMNVVQATVVESNKRANRRKYGGCLRMMTYRAFPRPTVALYSRTSYLGYIGQLDLLLAHKVIEMAADMIGEGLKVDDFAFRWHVEVAQFHGFKSMAYVFATDQQQYLNPKNKLWRKKDIRDYPTWKILSSWYARIRKMDKEGLPYSAMRYGAEKRVRRRLHAQLGVDNSDFTDSKHRAYPPLTTPIEELTLDRMLFKTPESRAVMRRKKKEKAEKLVLSLFDEESASDIIGNINGNYSLRLDDETPYDWAGLLGRDDE